MKKLFLMISIISLLMGTKAQTVDFTYIPTGTSSNLTAVWASDSNQAFAVGPGGLFIKYDGYNANIIPNSSTADLNCVSGSCAGYVWAGGDAGTVISFNGSDINVYAVNTTVDIQSIVVLNYNNVWVGGTNGFIGHWDGYNWNSIVSPYPTLNFTQILVGSGIGGVFMYFVGHDGVSTKLLTYNLDSFTEILSDPNNQWEQVYTSDNDFFYLFGNNIYSFNKTTNVITEVYHNCEGSYAFSSNEVVTTSSVTGVVYFSNSNWNIINSDNGFRSVYAPRNNHNKVYFAGENGLLAYCNLSVGIKEVSASPGELTVYWDANTKQLFINLTLKPGSNYNKLQIIDLGGKQVKKSFCFYDNKLQKTIDVSDLNSAPYFVVVTSGGQNLVQKFIVKK